MAVAEVYLLCVVKFKTVISHKNMIGQVTGYSRINTLVSVSSFGKIAILSIGICPEFHNRIPKQDQLKVMETCPQPPAGNLSEKL